MSFANSDVMHILWIKVLGAVFICNFSFTAISVAIATFSYGVRVLFGSSTLVCKFERESNG